MSNPFSQGGKMRLPRPRARAIVCAGMDAAPLFMSDGGVWILVVAAGLLTSRRLRRHRSARAFTMVELLLVIVLIGVLLGIAAPSLVRSIQGHRLRTAARTIVTVARYARNMALLKQSHVSITFNLDTGQVDLTSTNTTLPRFTRVVEGVVLASVAIEGEEPHTEGTCVVPYHRNGICKPFVVTMRDARGHTVKTKVDALSSVRTMEYDARGMRP